MYEQKVREQLQEAIDAGKEHYQLGDGPEPEVTTLHDYGMLTSDEGLVLSYPDGSVFTVHIGCYRRPEEPEEEAVA